MAQVTHTGNGDVSNTNNLGYSFTFPTLSQSAVKVSVNNVDKTVNSDYTIHNWTEAGNSNAYILFTSATARGTGTVRIYRHTHGSILKHTFQAGSAIKASDLNRVNLQALYLAEEAREYVNNLAFGGSPVVISGSNIADNSITTTKILDLEVGTADLSNGAVTTQKIGDTQVTETKLANNSVTTRAIKDGEITRPKIAPANITDVELSTTLSSNGIIPQRSGQFTAPNITVNDQGRVTAIQDGIIPTSQIANGAVTLDKISTTTQINLAVPVGTVLSFFSDTPPSGYLLCNGQAIPNGTGTINQLGVDITADFSALYDVIGQYLPHITDNRFINHASSNIGHRHDHDWKGFYLHSYQTGGTPYYTHTAYMGKSTNGYLPTGTTSDPAKWTAGNSGSQWAYRLQWDTTEVKPKGIVLLPIIKY